MLEIYKNFKEFESEKPLVIGAFIDKDLKLKKDLKIDDLLVEKVISFELGKVNKVYPLGKIKNKVLYLVGLGKLEDFTYENLEESLRGVNYKLGNELVIDLDSFVGSLEVGEVAKRLVKTINYYNYTYDEFLTKKFESDLSLKIVSKTDVTHLVNEALNLAVAVDNTRDLVNKPYNAMSATDLANYAVDLVKSFDNDKVSIRVYDKGKIEELKMNSFLSVNKGSVDEPKLIHIIYKNSAKDNIALVGKGVMFDTGGYSIKSSMNTMKCDMGGAASVLGTLEAVVKNNLEVNLQVVIAATDNRINGEALLPDDVVTAMNGKTIEIFSTDAEGRLTLADAVSFAQKNGAKTVVDVATLTGACVVALGDYTTGLFGNDETELKGMLDASKYANEHLWQLPITKTVREDVRSSKVADLKNSTGRLAGASGAAAFIEEFIEEGTKWLHIDIAGTAFRTSPRYKEFYGASGVPVNTMYEYLKAKSK